MTFSLLVFDLDDTLYHERDYVVSGFNYLDRYLDENYGVSGFGPKAIEAFNGGRRTRVIDTVLTELGVGVSELIVSELVNAYRAHTPDISISDIVKGGLTKWKQDYRLALLTDGFASAQRIKIGALHISEFFEEIIVTGEHGISWRKPGRAGFEYLQAHFAVRAENSIYIGDNPDKDFEGPMSLGWSVARIRSDMGIYSHLSTPDGIHEFSDFHEFRKWLDSL